MLQSRRSQVSELRDSMRKLNLTRKETEERVMLGGKDPSDYMCNELRTAYTWYEQEYNSAYNNCQKNAWRKLMSYVPRRIPKEAEENHLVTRMERLASTYETSSRVRRSFQQISSFALMKKPPFRTDAYHRIAPTEWHVKFDLISVSQEPSAWVVLGFEESEFQKWWTTRLTHSVLEVPAGQEWKDIKALYGGVVHTLEYLKLQDLRELFNKSFKNLQTLIQICGLNLSRAMNFPEYFSIVSQFVGFFAPFVHIALICLKSIKEALEKEKESGNDGNATFVFYERQVVSLEILAEALMSRSMELPRVDKQIKLSTIREAASEDRHNSEDPEVELALKSLDALPKYDAGVLVKLGLRQLSLSSTRGDQIGSGSYSTVFSRYDAEGNERFAVKEPAVGCRANHETIWNRVGREAQLWSTLTHEHILPLRGFYLLPGNIPALVMDLCENNLKEYVHQSTALSEKKKLQLLLEVAKALAYLHSENIAHGDLRASNILVKNFKPDNTRKAVLCDFGASYYADRELDPRHEDIIFETTRGQIGNPSWLAPELLRKASHSDHSPSKNEICISLAGDIYSFGCVILEVMYRRSPYQSFDDEDEKKRRKLNGELPATSSETCSKYFTFLSSLWHPDPECRPSAESVLTQIDTFHRQI